MQPYSKKLVLIACAICLAVSSLYAQQQTFTLYPQASAFLNPAAITLNQQRFVSLSHRSIFINAGDRMNLSSLRFYTPLNTSSNFAAVDGNVFGELTGPNGIFQHIGMVAGGAYDVKISSVHAVSFGLQGGAHFLSVNESRIRTDSKYSGGTFDPAAPSGEDLSGWKKTAFSFNAGLNWTFKGNRKPRNRSEDTQPVAWAGVAIYNLNRANTFYDDAEKTPMRLILSGGYLIEQGLYEIKPTARFVSEASSYLASAGVLVDYNVERAGSSLDKIGAGLWLSTAKSAALSLQMKYDKIFGTIAYEIPFQKGMNGNGTTSAVELHIGYAF